MFGVHFVDIYLQQSAPVCSEDNLASPDSSTRHCVLRIVAAMLASFNGLAVAGALPCESMDLLLKYFPADKLEGFVLASADLPGDTTLCVTWLRVAATVNRISTVADRCPLRLNYKHILLIMTQRCLDKAIVPIDLLQIAVGVLVDLMDSAQHEVSSTACVFLLLTASRR